jgi:TPP-dependent pyruvate/acetoin dehydrogenase alpha subunit
MPSNAIVGANIPIATGAALGFQLRGLNRVAVSFFGDGASNIGAFHEGLNLAAVKNAPVIFVCENNQYGASTAISSMIRIADIASRAAAYGIPGRVVDGMDVLAVHQAAQEAVDRARQGNGPTLLECKTYRFAGHSRGDPGGYRTRQEVEHWRERDPIPHLRGFLIKEHGLAETELDSIEQACQLEVEQAVEFARNSPDPEIKETYLHVFAERL